MKRLWISVAIMAGIFAGTLANNWYLGRLTGEMTDLLRTAQQYAESGDWETAKQHTAQAQQQWKDAEDYLYVVLRHNETDAVGASFREVSELLEWGEEAEYTSANAKLVEDIRLLAEMEEFSIKNLL